MPTSRVALALAIALSGFTLHCSSDDSAAGNPDGGGTVASGGAPSAGGASSTGGGTAASGGAPSAGGASSTGGATPRGGTSSTGGTTSNGGSATTGGAPSSGGGTSATGGSSSGGAGGSATIPGWKLTWSDEFDGASGAAVDGSKWNLVNKGDGFGNSELEFYTSGTNNAALDGQGDLVITARKEKHDSREYTSARLESIGKFEKAYGRFEARLKIPRGQGIWPAFWLLGANIASVPWPGCGEIDIMENVGKEPTIVHGSMHGPGYSGGNPLGKAYTLPDGKKFADDFHVFAVEWETNVVRFYVDGNLYQTRTPSDVPSGGHWVYDHPFLILLNVAVGGQWPGSPDGTTTFPQTMTVDYVRVYERS